MRFYLLDLLLERNRPVLFGLEAETGRRVCVRVLAFQWPTYVEPKTGGPLESEDSTLEWMRKCVVPHLGEGTVVGGCTKKVYLACGGNPVARWMGRLTHATPKAMRQTAADLHKEGVRVYNHNIDPVLTFLHLTGVRCHSYVDMAGERAVTERWSSCELEFVADAARISPVADQTLAPPSMSILSFDLETDGLCADKGDEIRMAAVHVDVFPEDPATRRRRSVLLSRYDFEHEDADYEVEVHESELALLTAFARLVSESRAVFVTGWNISGFDLDFVVKRCRALSGSLRALQPLSWLTTRPISAENKTLSTAAYGHNAMTILQHAPGPQWMDGLTLARKMQEKMQSYSLKAMAIWAGGGEKHDVTYAEMLEAFRTRDSGKLRVVADYCVQDARIVIPILRRMEEPDQVIAMTTLAAVPASYVISRGEQVLTWSLIVEEATMRHNMVINNVRDGQADVGSYKGATVIPPIKGYYPDPVGILDFKSLYPSCMLAYNICFSTHVGTFKDEATLREKYPFPEYAVISIENRRAAVFRCEGPRGIIPTVVQGLLNERSKFKKAMQSCEEGSVRHAQYNARQSVAKRRANSAYGFLGATTSPVAAIGAMDLASSITSAGREALQRTRNMIQDMCTAGDIPSDARVIYGDSVAGDTPLVVRHRGVMRTCRIDELELLDDTTWVRDADGKERITLADGDLWVMDGRGWTTVRRIIRHACAKPMVRVITHSGLVDCTTDHSLVRRDGSEVSPRDVKVGEELLHLDHHDDDVWSVARQNEGLCAEEAYAMGIFVATGGCGPEGWWIEMEHHLLGIVAKCLPFPVRVVPSRIVATGDAVDRYRALFYNAHGDKRIPPELLWAPLVIVQAFWEGYMTVFRTRVWDVALQGKELVAGLWILGHRMGSRVSTKHDSPHAIVSISRIDPTDVVYDLETQSHHFHVGPGTLVVHNTDSVMVHLPGMTAEAAEVVLRRISERVTSSFRPPMELEYEDIMLRCLFFNKKRYAGITILLKLIMKGISTKRRDFPPIVRNTVQAVLDALLQSTDGRGATRAIEVYARVMDDLIHHRVPWDDLVIVKELNKTDYSTKTKPPHATVAQKLKERDPGRGPRTGDRISFVITSVGSSRAGVADKSEDPAYAKENGLSPDYGYYAELMSSQVMEVLVVAGLGTEGARIRDLGIQRAKALCQGQTTLPWAPVGSLTEPPPAKKPRSEEVEAKPRTTKQTSLLSFFSPPPAR